jgi:hypothetical protein
MTDRANDTVQDAPALVLPPEEAPAPPAPDLTVTVCVRNADGSLGPPLPPGQRLAFQQWFEREWNDAMSPPHRARPGN